MTALVISDVLLQRNQSQLHHLELTPFGKWSVASPSQLFDWQVRYLDIYLFYVNVQYNTPPPSLPRLQGSEWSRNRDVRY